MTGKPEPELGLKGILKKHVLLAGLVAVYGTISFLVSQSHPVSVGESKFVALVTRFLGLVPQMLFLVLFWRLLNLTYVERSADRIGEMKREVRAFLTDRDRMKGGAIAVVIMTAMLVSFAQIKNLIPNLNPFEWDTYFSDLDRQLHFGALPHEYLLTIFGSHYVISFFTGIYNVWLFMMYFVLLIACFMRPQSNHRMRYLVAFVLTWAIGGNLLAAVFSSAGPVYYAKLGLGDAYTALMFELQSHAATGALTVVNTQDLLWTWYTAEKPINAISAFPSMHVASSTLMAIFAFGLSRRVGYAVSFFAAGIMIGSVLLGWHYAVDGYVGALIAILCWQVAGWLVVRNPFGKLRTAEQA
jgi:membrane-associated phospholipid phosphatase